MTTHELIERLGLKVYNEGESKSVKCGYCGDLLSWVMGRAPDDCVWVTVMSNTNVAAVAVLRDVSCVLLAEGSEPDDQLLERARLENLGLYGSELSAFELAEKIAPMI